MKIELRINVFPPRSRSRSEGVDDNVGEDIRGFRQWTPSLSEDLLDLREQLSVEKPELLEDDKEFSQQLLASFQERHPQCMESAR